MKFYLASSIENIENAKKVSAYLAYRGWSQTYDWTVHGPVNLDRDECGDIAQNEIAGVEAADVFFLLLPGRRGSHAEFGAALAMKKPVIILSTIKELLHNNTEVSCIFYWHPAVLERLVDDDLFNLSCKAHRAGVKQYIKQSSRGIEANGRV